MKSREFCERHLIPALKDLYGARWEGRVEHHEVDKHPLVPERNQHIVINVLDVEPGSHAHKTLRNVGQRNDVWRTHLADGTYSFVVER